MAAAITFACVVALRSTLLRRAGRLSALLSAALVVMTAPSIVIELVGHNHHGPKYS